MPASADQLSPQDIQDLRDVRGRLPQGDPRIDKLDRLLFGGATYRTNGAPAAGNSAMVPMLSPSGEIGDIPAENVGAAIQAGFKIGAEMLSPNGRLGVVPIERVTDATNAGFMIKPPPMPKANTFSATMQRLDAAMAANEAARQNASSATDSMARMYTGRQMATPEQEAEFQQGKAIGSLSGMATVGAMAAPEYGPTVAKLALKHPVVTALAVHVARELGVPLPKVLDVLSKFGSDGGQ